MPKPGIKIISDIVGSGPELRKGDRVRVKYDILLNRGDYVMQDAESVFTLDDREIIAGFRYGLEGMRAGGTRKFRAGPHLCYRELESDKIPKNAVLTFDVKRLEVLPPI